MPNRNWKHLKALRLRRLGRDAASVVSGNVAIVGNSIAENVAQGTVVGVVTATFGTGPYTYAIQTDADAKFAMSGRNLVIRNGATINYEVKTSHIVTIRATDSLAAFQDLTLTVQVIDVDDFPTTTGAATTLAAMVPTIGTGVAIGGDLRTLFGPDGKPHTYAVNVGTIAGDGYTWSYTPTFTDYQFYGGGRFDIVVTATDADGQTGVASLTGQTIDLNVQPPTYNDSTGTSKVLAGSAPVIVNATPADNATGVSTSQDLVQVFDRPVKFGAAGKKHTVRNVTGNAAIKAYDAVTDQGAGAGQHSISGATLTTRAATSWPSGVNISQQFDAGFVTNLSGVGMAEISGDTALDFTVQAAPTAPAQFQDAGWGVVSGSVAGGVDITITTLPNNGGSAITAIQFQVDGGGWASVGGTATGTYSVTGNGLLSNGTQHNISIRAVNAVGSGTASNTKAVTPPPLTQITVDSASLKFPDKNAEVATNSSAVHGRIADGTNWAPSTNNIFGPGADCAFAVMCQVPWESWNNGSNPFALCGNDSSQTVNQRMSIKLARTTYDQNNYAVQFFVRDNAGVILSGSVAVTRSQRRLLCVMAMRSGQMNFEVYNLGTLVGSLQPTMGSFAAMQLSSVLTYGSNGSGSGTNLSSSGQVRGFNGSISHIGYNNSGLSQANCQNMSLGVSWLSEVAPTTWRMYRRLTGTDATSLAKDASCTNDSTAPMVVLNPNNWIFRNGSDLVPARSGAAWFHLDHIPDGRVFARAVGSSTGRIFLSGQSSGLTGGVEARVFDAATGQLTKNWSLLTNATLTGGGAWSGYIDAPKNNGWGHIDVRPALTPSLVQRSRARSGVGLWIVPNGQSQVDRLNSISAGIQPSQSPPLSVGFITGRQTNVNWGFTFYPASTERRTSDGVATLLDEVAKYTTEPVMLTWVSQGGTNPRQLVNDTLDTTWSWAEIEDWLGLLMGPLPQRSGGVIVINWYSDIMTDTAQPAGIMGEYYQPLIAGTRPGNATNTYSIDHYFLDGLTFPSNVKIGASWPTMYASTGSGGAGPFDTSQNQATTQNRTVALQQWIDWVAANPSLVAGSGPYTDDLRMENSGGPHQLSSAQSRYGHGRTLLRMFITGLRAYGVDTRTDPSLNTATINGGRTAITITVNRPNGGTLQTAWGIAGVAVPTGENDVQGFEVEDGGAGVWSRSTFTTAIVSNTVVLTKKTGAWLANTRVRYLYGGPLDFGTTLIPSELFHGCLYESGIDENGIGLPLAGKWGPVTIA